MANTIEQELTYSFPAIRGIQAGREFYITMMRMRHAVQILAAGHEESSPENRAQRSLNKGRIPAISRYILENPREYVFSALTASVGGQARFEPIGTGTVASKLGTLHISADSPISVNDGQHRRAAIEAALKENPALGSESISVVLFVDAGLRRSQQVFADLNRFAVRPTPSLTILYDSRDGVGALAKSLAESVPVFRGMTETAKSTISNRSRKLFTLSSICLSTRRLLKARPSVAITRTEADLALRYWTAVGNAMTDWKAAVEGRVSPAELRRDYVHAHGVALQSLAVAGRALIESVPTGWEDRIKRLATIDWARSNTRLWEGKALHNGRVSKAQASIEAMAGVIEQAFGLGV